MQDQLRLIVANLNAMKKVFHFLLLLSPAAYAQSASDLTDSIPESDTLNYRKNYIHCYYSVDHESRSMYTDHGIQDGRQGPLVSSWTLGIGWTGDITRHITLSAGIEYSFKTVITDTIELNDPIERSVHYRNEVSYANIPLTIHYMVGNKFRIGILAGTALKYKLLESGHSFRWHNDGSGTSEPPAGHTNFPLRRSSRLNQDIRVGAIFEYNFKNSRIRLLPVYRFDLFNTYKQIEVKKATNFGLQVEYNF